MRLGWIGLGVMGGKIALRLAAAGHEVIGWNRTAEKAHWVTEHGVTLVDTAAEVGESCDVVFMMLTNAQSVHEVLTAEDGLLAHIRPGTIVADISTIDPASSRRHAELVAAAGALQLDCPVSGGVDAVEPGELVFMVGGDRQAFESITPLLLDIGRRATHVGDNGQGLTLKAGINLSLAVQIIGFSEGAVLAEKAGIDRETIVDVMTNCAISSPNVKLRGPATLEGGLPRPPWFDCSKMQKDLRFALDLGKEFAVPMPAAGLADQMMSACRGSGLGDEDFSVVFHLVARLAGLEQ